MADKNYKLKFQLSDGSAKEVQFSVPQGENGKSAYEYAQDGGYTGTEEEFAAKLAAENSGGGGGGTADSVAWENVTGKPFQDNTVETVVLEETLVEEGALPLIELVAGRKYIVSVNGVEYFCVPRELDGALALGSLELMYGDSSGVPFLLLPIADFGMTFFMTTMTETEITVKITGFLGECDKLDPVLIDCEWSATLSTVYRPIVAETTLSGTPSEEIEISHKSTELYEAWMLNATNIYIVENGIRHTANGTGGNGYALFIPLVGDIKTICVSAVFVTEDTIKIKVHTAGTFTLEIGILSYIRNRLYEEFMPESLDSVVLRSTTVESMKRFKITVDDSGTLSVTEVT